MIGPRHLLAAKIATWRADPAQMVRELFGVEPDLWQADVLKAFPRHQRLAMKACKGPGKTTVLSWLAWNFLLCYDSPKIAAVSITGDNLSDGLWAEMAKWMAKAKSLPHLFTWTKTRIFAKHSPETWFMSFRTWQKSASSEQQANTLAGLHADNMMFVIDEAGGIPDAVLAAAEAGLANAMPGNGQTARIVMAGNPTHLDGPLYRATVRDRGMWHVTEITADPDDPKRTPRVSAEWAREQIASHGADNPWVLVNVFGRFPPSSIDSLIGPDEVRDALSRTYNQSDIEGFPKILGVDVALYGDDSSVIFRRQGIAALPPKVIRNASPRHGAGLMCREWRDWGADACFIDSTGGFGDTWAAVAEDLNFVPNRILFNGPSINPRYFNKRTEMWFNLVEWIKGGGVLPPGCEGMVAELSQCTYSFKGDKLILEPKQSLKGKIGRSPDMTDALSLTFAMPVARPVGLDSPRNERVLLGNQYGGSAETSYEVF